MPDLASRTCAPSDETLRPLSADAAQRLVGALEEGWAVELDGHLVRTFTFPAYESGLDYVNRLGLLAEDEGHHPDMRLARREVRVDLWSYAIGALSENDFILAAKADELFHTMHTANRADLRVLKGEEADAHAALGETEARARLAQLGAEWRLEQGALVRTYAFDGFVRAMRFVNRISALATQRRHHPGIHVGWRRVTVRLWTFPTGGLTEADFGLAQDADGAFRWAQRP